MRRQNALSGMDGGNASDLTEFILEELHGKGESGLARLWQEWFPPLVGFLNGRLGRRHDPLIDPEEIAADTLRWFARSARTRVGISLRAHQGRILRHGATLRLLERVRRSRRLKRDERRNRAGDDSRLERIPDVRRSGEKSVDFKDELLRLIALLSHETLRSIASKFWLEEHSTLEISESLGISLRSVELKLKSIHERWCRHFQSPPPPPRQRRS